MTASTVVIGGLLLGALLVGHLIADTVLQPAWLSVAKRTPGLRLAALGWHGSLHGFSVLMFTGMPLLALAEAVIHPLVDHGKALGWYGVRIDQAVHIACKVVWTGLWLRALA